MKKVLVIDDVRLFDIPDAEITYARTVPAARIELMREWDEVWFDYDMGLAHFNGANVSRLDYEKLELMLADTTTYPLACDIEEGTLPLSAGKVFVHTANPEGAVRLMQSLKSFSPTRVPTLSAPLARNYTMLMYNWGE